ncbi:MAG: beta-xylosidase [Chitinophagaceae bacterium]
MKKVSVMLLAFFMHSLLANGQAGADTAYIYVDAAAELGNMQPAWAWFGYDEPNFTYMKDGKKLLSEIAALSPVPVYVRAHNLLTSGDGRPALKWGSTNAYTEDANGRPVYNWHIVDSIFDTYVQRGMKPLAQMGFMPEALSAQPQPYQHHWQPGQDYRTIFTGWTYPPKDYAKWGELIYQWVKHCTTRYGAKEVATWYWELWNEPNGNGYWKGTVQEYCKLYDYSAAAVKRALPAARVGGPHVTGPSGKGAADFLKTFLNHCINDTNYTTGKIGSPIDFIAFHAKGAPRLVNNHVRMNVGQQLRDISTGFAIVAAYPSLKALPIIIGESDPEGCAACGMATNPENAYRNGTMYSSYTAASFARKYLLADYHQVNFLGAVSWSFEFEDQPWFYGFRDLATNGVDKPVLNVFRMFGMMKGKRIATTGSKMYATLNMRDSSVRKGNDVGAIAAKGSNTITVLLWNYHDDDTARIAEKISVQIKNITSKKVRVSEYRIDKEHSNSYEVWKQMGSPAQPSPAQVSQLEKAGQLELVKKPGIVFPVKGMLQYRSVLTGQAVSLLKIEW